MRNIRIAVLFMALCAINISFAVAQQRDDLQEFINNSRENLTRSTGENVIDVDLSTFTSTKRTTTLQIANGGNFRFINGVLERDETLNDPVILISNGSTVDVAEGATITGENHLADYEECEIVRLDNGILNVSGGTIVGAEGVRNQPGLPIGAITRDPAIRMISPEDEFYLNGGTILGNICCNTTGVICLNEGNLRKESMIGNSIITHSDVYLNGAEVVSFLRIEEPDGSLRNVLVPFNITLCDKSVLYLQNKYEYGFNLTLWNKQAGDVVAAGDNYTITQEDVDMMNVSMGNTAQIYGLKLKDNKVYLTYKVDNVDDLQASLDSIASKGVWIPDTIEIAEEGLLVDKPLYVRNGCHAVLTGGTLQISPTIDSDYCITVDDKSELILDDITVDLMNKNGEIFHVGVGGRLCIGGNLEGDVRFINVLPSGSGYGGSIFYVDEGACLDLREGRIETGNLRVIYARYAAQILIRGAVIRSSGVPTIQGGYVYLSGGEVAGDDKEKGIIVAAHFEMEAGKLSDRRGGSILFSVGEALLVGDCAIEGKYNKIVVERYATLLGSLNLQTLYISRPEDFDSFTIQGNLTAPNGWKFDAADWTKMELEKAFITGNELTKEDFDKMEFLNIPASLEVYFDEANKAVKLRKNTSVDDLQEFINQQTGDVIMVNLSQFASTTRQKTLEVKTGRKYHFYGGTLKRGADCTGPLMTIGEGSTVEIGSLDGDKNKRAWLDAYGVITGVEMVRMEGGTLNVTEGSIKAWYSNESEGDYDNAVLMTSDKDVFTLESSASMSGPLVCTASQASISIKGWMHTRSADFGTIKTYSDVTIAGDIWLHVELLGKDNVVKLTSALERKLEITAKEKTYNDAILVGSDFQLASDANIKNFKYVAFTGNKEYPLRLEDNKVLLGIDDLQDFIENPGDNNGKGTEDDPIKGNIGCEGVDVNDDLKFKDDLQYFFSGEQSSEEDCNGTIRQNEGDVTIPTGTTVTYTHLYLQGCGCDKYVYVHGTLIIDYNIHIQNYLRFIYLRPGGRVIIRGLEGEVTNEIFYVEGGTVEYRGGNVSGGKYGWWNVGGTVYIYDGTIKGETCGGYTDLNGTTCIYGGLVVGGLYNHGVTYLYGGEISASSDYTIYNYQGGVFYIYGGTCDGSGSIWNQGTIYLDGGNEVNIGEIFAVSGCRIHIVSKLTYILRIHITIDNIILNTPIILGGDGYVLTEEDCNNIHITLPDGYGWRYDNVSGGIVIYLVNAISENNTDKPTVEKSYDVTGRELQEAGKGLNIQRMSDGTIKKVINK